MTLRFNKNPPISTSLCPSINKTLPRIQAQSRHWRKSEKSGGITCFKDTSLNAKAWFLKPGSHSSWESDSYDFLILGFLRLLRFLGQPGTHRKNRPLVFICNGVETMPWKVLPYVLVSKSCKTLSSMSGQRSSIDYPFQAIKFIYNSDSPFSYLVFDWMNEGRR